MKRAILSMLILAFCSPLFAEEEKETPNRYGEGAICAQRESSVLSIMGWGVGLFAGIAIFCSLMEHGQDDPAQNAHSAHSH